MDFKLLKVGHCFHPEAMVMRGGSWRCAMFPAVVALIKHPRYGYMLFDTGYAKRFKEATKNFPERIFSLMIPVGLPSDEQLVTQLQAMGIDQADIKYIFISHFHADHIAGLRDFHSATYICSKNGFNIIQKLTGFRGVAKGYINQLLPPDFVTRVRFIEDMMQIPLGQSMHPFTMGHDLFADGSCIAINLPGHADGQNGLLFHDGTKVRFLVADACWTERAYTENRRPNPIAMLAMSNADQYNETLDRLSLLYGQNGTIQMIPSHCCRAFEAYKNE